MNRPPEYWLRKARLYFTLHHEELEKWRKAETGQTVFCDKCLNSMFNGCLLCGKKKLIFKHDLGEAALITYFGDLTKRFGVRIWHCGEWVKNV